nr:protease inhibitor I42 family protein [Rhodococcus sp. HNM0569]
MIAATGTAGCAGTDSTPPTHSDIPSSVPDTAAESAVPAGSGETVSLAAGGQARVSLPESAGTGYSWTLTDMPAAVRVVDEQYEDSSTGAVGGGGTRVFVLTATEPGTYEVVASLARPWEQTPAETRAIAVVVS